MTRISRASLVPLATTFLLALGAGAARADTVVQFPLAGVLDARSVTTLTGGQLVVWTLPTDGGGLQNAFATAAVATMQGAPAANALPDDGRFAADARHPGVVLHFSNAGDAASPQTHLVKPSGSFTFAIPAATYSKLFFFFNGAAGGTTIKVTLAYADATTEIQNATVPDYYANVPATDPVIFNLATNLAKWNKNTQIAEANHHNITGVELHPMASKSLTGVQVDRGANGYLVFWGATGIATSPVDGGTATSGTSTGSAGSASGTSMSGAATGSSTSGTTTGGTSGTVASSGGASGASTGVAATGATSSGTVAGTGNATSGSAASTGAAATGSVMSASGMPSGASTLSSGAGSAPPSASGGGCSFSASPTSHLAIWGSLLALCGTAFRRRRSAVS